MRVLGLCLLATALLVVLVPISGADESAPKPRPYAIGEFVEGISGTCLDGSALSLDDFEISARSAEKTVLEAASKLAGGKPLTLETKVETLGEANTAILVSEIGRRFGIAMTDEALADLETLDDVKSWVEEHEDAAIAIVTWSPGCSVCEESYTAKLAEIHREDTIRLVVLACDASDTPKTLLDAVTKQNAYWRVLIDKEQKISDRFGASVTPEVFVLDTELRLRYRGAIDSDPAAAVDEGDREFLREAAAAIVMEEPVLILRTEPNGCPIKRK